MICPITYEPIGEGEKYSLRGLQMFSRNLQSLHDLPLSAEEQRAEALARVGKMSIQGVQPKLSAVLNVRQGRFDVVDIGGTYILKPQNTFYPELPENEDLSMRLAAAAGIEVPLHALVYSRDHSLTYVIKRFDRIAGGRKLAVEDFAQISGKNRDTKYDSSMEQVAELVERFCTFPAVEKVRLLRLALVSYLIGNEDLHLKNFSMIRREDKVELSPGYDILNSTIAVRNPREELALPLRGKKRNITRKMLIEYYAGERLGLNEKTIAGILANISEAFPVWEALITKSFLSEPLKERYRQVVEQRRGILGI